MTVLEGPAVFTLDEATLTRTVHAQWPSLVRLARLLLGDDVHPEDVVQDACEAVWRLKPNLRDEEHLIAYVRTAVVNRTRSIGRRRRTVQRFLSLAREEHEPAAEDRVLADADAQQIATAVVQLPQRQREVLVLRYWAHLSIAEIAETLGIPEGTVKSANHRALVALKTALGEIR